MFKKKKKKVLTNWSLKEEYKDLIAEEYYYLVYQKLIHLSASDNTLNYEQQHEQVINLLNDVDLLYPLNHLDRVNSQSKFDRLLIHQIRKGNSKNVIKLLSRRNGAIHFRDTLSQKMRKIFS